MVAVKWRERSHVLREKRKKTVAPSEKRNLARGVQGGRVGLLGTSIKRLESVDREIGLS